MNDRELLELAAKAAGIVIWKHGKTGGGYINDRAEAWSPLTDDGDAFRLMIGLQIRLDYAFDLVTCSFHKDWMSEPSTAEGVRRLVVRVAAEIGRNMGEAPC